ncbi:uncharacterized protein EAF02_002029 [Botrytis sinoallii]|uniref:uncharacterized protein n=1 Tax=Botrytis sinoallii TaxID=1463999 RepID=UPI0018FFD5D9|nr:uncharacterized protein EAF02_002029 [Botrytis sinoallii]KAF7889614.1 hypothetical protein EAF02_002029 [Botrytis sinoallii]
MRLSRPSFLLKWGRQPFKRPFMALNTRTPRTLRNYSTANDPNVSNSDLANDLIPTHSIDYEESMKMIGKIEKELEEKRLLTEQVNMLELIRLRSMYFRMVKEKGTVLRKQQSQLDAMEMERRQSFKVFLPNSIRQANKFQQLEIIFDATFGISKDDAKTLLIMDESCDEEYKVQYTLEAHGLVFSRLMPDTFPPVFKEWLETIREVKARINYVEAAYRRSATVEEDGALKAPDLFSTADDRLCEKAKELTEACDLAYLDDFKTFSKSTYPLWKYKDRMIAEWEERKLMPELMAAAEANRKIYWRYL